MDKRMTGLKLIFRNGEYWVIDKDMIGDLWIKHITTSFGRINGSDFQEIHPCESFKIEVLPEADHVQTENINYGGLESGMFARITGYSDIERMEVMYDASNEDPQTEKLIDRIYFPYEAMDPDGIDNRYQSTKVADNGNLYIAIDYDKKVEDLFPDLAK